MYTKADCINALQRADEMIDGIVTFREYLSLDIDGPGRSTIQNRFDSWNDAKDAAGLDVVYGKRPGRLNVWKRYIEARENSSCLDCGEDDPRTIHFHHVNGDKSGTISDMVRGNASLDELNSELDKCVPLCANCHQRRHNEWPPSDSPEVALY